MIDEAAALQPRASCRFDLPYLLALNVPLCEQAGMVHADASWAKDLEKHLSYIPRLTLFCPVVPDPLPGWVQVRRGDLRVVGFDAPRSSWAFLGALPQIAVNLWREVGRATIVHTGVAGWPYPLGWLAVPMARLRRKRIVVIVESAFWRSTPGLQPGLRKRVAMRLWEAAARACLRRADYAAYTQADYQESLPSPRAGGGILIQASWVDRSDCLDPEAAARSWAGKRGETIRLLFAARLVPEKGTRVLADALRMLAAENADLQIDVLGEGPEQNVLRQAAAGAWGDAHVRFLAPVPYGPAFLEMVRAYHAVLAPGLSDEQPRIVYDAYSQAVPAIGSDTAGLRQCITPGETGALVPPGDATALAECLARLSTAELEAWGLEGLGRVGRFTHDGLHEERCRELNRLFGKTS